MIVVLVLAGILIIAVWWYLRQAKFGKDPRGPHLARIAHSPHFRKGAFQNLSETPALTEGHNYFSIIYENYFKKKPRQYPKDEIPAVKTDLKNLPIHSNLLVWFGHSSYYLQVDGKRLLVDPVFSGNASPLPGTVKSFLGTDRYSAADLPDIDYLFITHDHYDHVDYETLIALKSKIKTILCGLGVGSHFIHWGFSPETIIEKDWYEKLEIGADFTVFVEPARHFSGRKLTRNQTLWVSYLLKTPGITIYLGGDSGYDTHYAAIGSKYTPIDLAILDNGQYDKAWKYIHNHPEDTLQAALDLKAKRLFPVHSSKFALAAHAWDDPLRRISELCKSNGVPLVTPMIGEPVDLNNPNQQFKEWWTPVR
ncbi:MAG: MBL fold metallo-hydrolase [Saprospiraceae bacterium]|nr:MBL fold metallo-hydrolase [Saprospiraceae bacterium]HPG07247.1 MBL fold metallo-hydrolase [Saprospiraceae bacterium]